MKQIKNRKYIIFNIANKSKSKKISNSITDKVIIASLIDKKIEINLNELSSQKDTPFIGQREVAWVRIIDKNGVISDYIITNAIIIVTKEGGIFEIRGNFIEVSIDYVAEKIANFAKENNFEVVDSTLMFQYKKITGRQIKKDFNFLISRTVDMSIDRFKYNKKRLNIFARMLTLSIVKKIINESNSRLNSKIIERLNNVE